MTSYDISKEADCKRKEIKGLIHSHEKWDWIPPEPQG